MSVKEFFQLLYINFKVKILNWIEFLKVIFYYYSNFNFFKIDLRLLTSYLFSNPFRISKQYLISKGEKEIYAYGETPLTTVDVIAKKCGLTPHDIVYELGCGRGRACFWLHQFVGCRVIGIDFVPEFIYKANKIVQHFDLQGIKFKEVDFFNVSLSEATVIYLYGTCLNDGQIKRLVKRFSTLPHGIKVITVSYSLLDYDPDCGFEILDCFPCQFSWGKTDVYLQVNKKNNIHH